MSDKRTVSTDALETLGTIIDDKAGRDAIHLAVEPAIAAQRLYPGQDVGFTGGEAMASANPVGIVDPFLKAPVQVGERFWLVVYPRQITSLRHVWEHPAFPESSKKSAEKTDKEKSEEWLRHWCDTNDVPAYESIIEGLLNSHGGDDYGHVVHQGEARGAVARKGATMTGEFKHRADFDPTVMAAFREGREANDIYVVYCSDCKAWSYWNQGSHCNCRFCLADLNDDEAITMADYWTETVYPCDEVRAGAAPSQAGEGKA